MWRRCSRARTPGSSTAGPTATTSWPGGSWACSAVPPWISTATAERSFVNELGAAADFSGSEFDEGFLSADIVAFGGTALVPGLHDDLPRVLREARPGQKREPVESYHADWLGQSACWSLGI